MTLRWQSSQISLIGSETHSFRYDLTLTRFVSSFSLISELLRAFLTHSHSFHIPDKYDSTNTGRGLEDGREEL